MNKNFSKYKPKVNNSSFFFKKKYLELVGSTFCHNKSYKFLGQKCFLLLCWIYNLNEEEKRAQKANSPRIECTSLQALVIDLGLICISFFAFSKDSNWARDHPRSIQRLRGVFKLWETTVPLQKLKLIKSEFLIFILIQYSPHI